MSFFTRIQKANPYHAKDGKFTSKDHAEEPGATHTSPEKEAPTASQPAHEPSGDGTPQHPIECGDDIEKAAQLIAAGKHVTLNQPDEVSTLVEKIKNEFDADKAAGKKPPVWNVADISVKGTNLFAVDNLGIPRVEMPQFSGTVTPGSKAAALLKPGEQEVDVTDQFLKSLKDKGISTSDEVVPASHLRATQDELDGVKVGKIADAMEAGKVKEATIVVTKDNYILDGHHRWAATIVRDLKDNHPGDLTMPVHKVNIDIGTALTLGRQFEDEWGIERQTIGKGPTNVGSKKMDLVGYSMGIRRKPMVKTPSLKRR